jgi:hypothetical protein
MLDIHPNKSRFIIFFFKSEFYFIFIFYLQIKIILKDINQHNSNHKRVKKEYRLYIAQC